MTTKEQIRKDNPHLTEAFDSVDNMVAGLMAEGFSEEDAKAAVQGLLMEELGKLEQERADGGTQD